jgi:hypothetical protein
MSDADTAVVSLAAFALSFAGLRQALHRGQMTAEEVAELLDLTLTALEQLGQGAAVDGARQLLEDTFRVLPAPSPKSSRSPRRRPGPPEEEI